jgi:hypothetical protein
MTSVTRSPARSGLVRWRVALLAGSMGLVLALGAAGCDSGDDIAGNEDGSPSDHGTDAPEVVTVTTLQNVGKKLDLEHRTRVKVGITEVIDPWFDGAFIGDFPRDDYADAFVGFTEGAAADAQGALDVLSNEPIADQIESATATRRRVRLDVFAFDGHPRGATAHFVLIFTTSGDVEETLRVRGNLYVAKDKGEWKIFGYDVNQTEQL